MNATDAKMQKIEPDPNVLWRTNVSEAVCKGRIYFQRAKISDT